ncbi:MAG: flagellar hook-basal body complex protein FliE [Rhodospirillaceae bacterium]|nr:flagellar hook-basal body complex protein FliE [Rhodospirillaceae bacterium]|tara:strand:- start:1304 stop:1603 length:300 start_codon:yes stop_codon:yes gene_type:complete
MVNRIGEALSQLSKTGDLSNIGDKTSAGKDFASFVREATRDGIDTLKTGETMSMKGIAGEADLNDVVSAVNSAEATLQLVTTLREKMIQAYQEVMRMPI